jgi:hypothetical protein
VCELQSPLSWVDERRGRLTEPLCDAHREVHVREASGAQIGVKSGEVVYDDYRTNSWSF